MDIAYVAGFFDGEGYIGIHGSSIQVEIEQCREEVISQIHEKFGGKKYFIGRNHKNPNWRDIHRWRLWGPEAIEFLETCLPYLIVKKSEAEFAINFWRAEDRLQRRDEYNEELKLLRKAA